MSNKVNRYKNGLRAFLAFGNWTNGATAGPAALNSNNSPSNRNSSIAARSALDVCQKRKPHGVYDSALSNGLRYMDDFIIIHHEKKHLHGLRAKIEPWLDQELQLALNAKTAIFPVSRTKGRSLDFLGYKLLCNSKRLRVGAVKALRKKMKKLHNDFASSEIGFLEIRQGLASHIGHAKHADSNAILIEIFNQPFKRAA